MYDNADGYVRRFGHAERARSNSRELTHDAHGFASGKANGAFHMRGDGGFEAGSNASDDSDALDYAAFFRKLWRRKLLFITIAVLATGFTTLIILRLPPHYVAHALVVVGGPSVADHSGQDAAAAAPPDAGAVQTNVELIKSPELAAEVVRRLKLEKNPEFNPAVAKHDASAVMARITGIISRIKEWGFGPQASSAPHADASAALSRAVNDFLGRLSVSIKDNSRMIDVAFDSVDPRQAMQVVNTLIDSYVNKQLQMRAQSAQRRSDWLRDRIDQLQGQVENAERAVAKYRSDKGLFSIPGGAPLLLKEMTDVSAELAKAQTARSAIEASLRQLRTSLRSVGRNGKSGDIADVIDSPLMRKLDADQAEAQQQLAEISEKYGQKHPKTVSLLQRLRSIHAAMRRESLRVVSSLDNDLRTARLKEENLSQRLARLKSDVSRMNGADVTLGALEHKAKADRLLLNNFVERLQTSSQKTDPASLVADVQIASYAQLPVSPERPKKELLILVAGIIALIGAVLVVVVVEGSDRTLHSLKEIEARLKLAGLGMLPISNSARLSAPEAARYGSAYREALKATYLNIFKSREEPQVTVVTSAMPGEGKTTLALSLAAMAAQGGQRVILVDADFWKKGASTALGFRSGVGLAEVLEGKIGCSDAIISDAVLGADFMLPGRFSRGSLLAWISDFRELLVSLRNDYDLVIIDAPPVLSASEAALLAKYADATVMTVRWGSTVRDAAEAASRKLRDAGALLAGSVITMVHERQHASYGYMESTYFSSEFKTYQSSPTGAITRSYTTEGSGERTRGEAQNKWGGARNRALLVLDMQKNPGSSSGWHSLSKVARDRLIETINGVSEMAAKSGMTVIYAQQGHGGTAAKAFSYALTKRDNSTTTTPDPSVRMVSELSFHKRVSDAFSSAQLNSFLLEKGIDHLFIVGADGVTSIKQTARSALDRGYRVTFIQDGIFTSSESRWKRLLTLFESAAAFAITKDEFAEFCQRLSKCATA